MFLFCSTFFRRPFLHLNFVVGIMRTTVLTVKARKFFNKSKWINGCHTLKVAVGARYSLNVFCCFSVQIFCHKNQNEASLAAIFATRAIFLFSKRCIFTCIIYFQKHLKTQNNFIRIKFSL